jgi:hypothetical protein
LSWNIDGNDGKKRLFFVTRWPNFEEEAGDDEEPDCDEEPEPDDTDAALDSTISGPDIAPTFAFLPGRSEPEMMAPALTGVPTMLKMQELFDWSDGHVRCRSREGLGSFSSQEPHLATPQARDRGDYSVATCRKALLGMRFTEAMGVEHGGLLTFVSHVDADDELDVPTPGKWLYVTLGKYSMTSSVNGMASHRVQRCNMGTLLQVCYHGTSLSSAAFILAGGFEEGPNITGDKRGIYMEGARRISCVLNYMTHIHAVAEEVHPLTMWAC